MDPRKGAPSAGSLLRAWRGTASLRFLTGGLLLVSLLEIGARVQGGIWSILGARVWLVWGIGTALATGGYAVRALLEDLRERRWLPVLFLGCLGWFLLVSEASPRLGELSYEATQQVAAGLGAFGQEDWNYAGKAYLGYPARPYLLAALPTLALGRSLLALHLGYALPFLLGLGAFHAGLRSHALRLGVPSELAVLPTALLATFPLLTEYVLIFEQALLPVSLTLGALGWSLLALDRFDPLRILALTWVLCLLTASYTPSLAGAVLFFVLLLQGAFRLLREPGSLGLRSGEDPAPRAAGFLLAALTLGVFWIASLMGGGGDEGLRLGEGSLPAAAEGLKVLLWDRPVPFSGVLRPLVAGYVLLALTGLPGPGHRTVGFWVLGVFAASTALRGYRPCAPELAVQRALLTAPVLCAGLCAALLPLLRAPEQGGGNLGRTAKGILGGLLLASLALAVWNAGRPNRSMDYYNHVQPMKHLILDLTREAAHRGLSPQDPLTVVVCTGSPLLRNPGDYLAYFLPGARVLVPTGEPPDPSGLLPPVIAYSDREPPFRIGAEAAEELRFPPGKRGDRVRLLRVVLEGRP